ncbi:hypothetical protein HFD98_22960 [Pseudomonas sp. EKM23D]|uniref:hypothetical protein n=1 Tax=unclassified Pseudomonas TaxID=196821 RepID=UPI00142E594D|nr:MULTISPECIES: hypothetical protein [unclassified Pseudomonas]KAF6687475.1 hypothetical protein HFD98_22960 [Pseudomonas sp. EKM23D]
MPEQHDFSSIPVVLAFTSPVVIFVVHDHPFAAHGQCDGEERTLERLDIGGFHVAAQVRETLFDSMRLSSANGQLTSQAVSKMDRYSTEQIQR